MKCRVCKNQNLVSIVDLGEQYLTGVFPESPGEFISKGPLILLKCHSDISESNVCSLLQLSHSFNLSEMYGDNYGYRSGLNESMVAHLNQKVDKIVENFRPQIGDLVVDIGSNDGTTLGFYPKGLRCIGIDPTGEKFRKYYQKDIELLAMFFDSKDLLLHTNGEKCKIITSFSMFYDLESPVEFCQQIKKVLSDDGIWVLEQSYMPLMLARNSFDTICHEHLEYYGLTQINWILEASGLKAIDVELNDINGGSFSVTVTHKSSNLQVKNSITNLVNSENKLGLSTLAPYEIFQKNIIETKIQLTDFLKECKVRGKRVAALGASTKGNVLLQWLGVTETDIVAIGEINVEKFGRLTPGTNIPIVDEAVLLLEEIDYFIVLPWHFRRYFIECGRYTGKTLVFPLPTLDVVSV